MGVAGHHVPVWYDEASGPASGQVMSWNAVTGRWEATDIDTSAIDTAGLATDDELAAGLATKQDTIPPGTLVQTLTANLSGDDSTDNQASLVATESAGDNPILTPGTYRVGANTALSKRWQFQRGAKLKPASGVAVTISGEIDAGPHQIFDLSLGGTVVFAAGARTLQVYPEWWGAAGDDATDDTSALQAAATAAATIVGGTLALTRPVYKVRNITIPDDAEITIASVGKSMSHLKHITATTHMITNAGSGNVSMFRVDGVCFDGNKADATVLAARKRAISLKVVRFDVDRCHFRNTINAAIVLDEITEYCRITRSEFRDMEEHTGVAGSTTVAVSLRGTGNNVSDILFSDNIVSHGTPAVGGRNPGGFYLNWDDAANVNSVRCTVRGNSFENIGQNAAGNKVAAIQIYRQSHHLQVIGNKLVNSGFAAIDCQKVEEAVIALNTIEGKSGDGAGDGMITVANREAGTGTTYNRRVVIIANTIRNVPTYQGIVANYGTPGHEGGELIVANNIVDGAAAGFKCDGLAGALHVVDNTFVNLDVGALSVATIKGINVLNIIDGATIQCRGNIVRYSTGATTPGPGISILNPATPIVASYAIVSENIISGGTTGLQVRMHTVAKVERNVIISLSAGTEVVDVENNTTAHVIGNWAFAGASVDTSPGVTTLHQWGNSFDSFSAYTPTNVVTDRAFDANATTVEELADVVGTLIADLQARKLVG